MGTRTEKRPLKKLRVDYKDPQFYTYQTDKGDFNCTQTLASLLLVVHCIKFRMASLNSLPYMSKRMPEAAKNYSITELEMCGLAINIMSFAHLSKKVDFDAMVDNLAITDIVKSKADPLQLELKDF